MKRRRLRHQAYIFAAQFDGCRMNEAVVKVSRNDKPQTMFSIVLLFAMFASTLNIISIFLHLDVDDCAAVGGSAPGKNSTC